MDFNIKHIFSGDSAAEIKDKVNYNFNQIISFSAGPDGHIGDKGIKGFPGPSGKRGATGSQGTRANNWYRQSIQPVGPIPFDKWIDESTSNNAIMEFSTGGSWVDTGYAIFTSSFFKSYDGVIGPGGIIYRFSIGFSNSGVVNTNETSLLVSDKIPTSSDSNPNRTKLIISTSDQTSSPILAFTKANLVDSGMPSFYWRNTGQSAFLRFYSGYSFTFNSILGLTVDSATSRTLLYGNSMNITAVGDFRLFVGSDFYFNSNVTSGKSTAFSVSSSNIILNSTYFRSNIPIAITSGQTGAFALDTNKNVIGLSGTSYGVIIETTNSAPNSFEFLDSNGVQILAGKTKSAVGSGNYNQVVFGQSGGIGGTSGPYLYHVKRVTEVRSNFVGPLPCYEYGTTSTSNITYIDLSSAALWDTNYLLVTPPLGAYTHIKIPSPITPLDPIYSLNTGGNYRILFNDNAHVSTTDGREGSFYGLVWDYNSFSLGRTIRYFLTFPQRIDSTSQTPGCTYVDLFYSPITSTTNANPKIFWKTCNGSAGFINVTDKYNVGTSTSTSTPTTSGSANSGIGIGGGLIQN